MRQYITDFHPLYSFLLLGGVGMAAVLLDTVLKRKRHSIIAWFTAIGAAAALVLDSRAGDSAPWHAMVVFDAFSRAFNAVFLITLVIVAIGFASEERKERSAGEYCGLMVFATLGLMLTASSGGLLTLYLGIDMATISLFALVGFARQEQRSAEAALKMVIVGGVASAVTLYGASVLYGLLGTTQFGGMAAALGTIQSGPERWALWLGVAFVVGGLGFKIAAVPFHLWAPDVYEGAPAIVTAYLSTASKAGGFAALLRFMMLGMNGQWADWSGLFVVLAVLSMAFGNFVAIWQTNLKRLLAYSGIAQAGYILVGVAAALSSNSGLGISAVFLYLLLYVFTNVGGFLVAQAIYRATGSDDVDALAGLHKRAPLLAFAMLIVLFSLGGIPPLAGFVGKLYLFASGWDGRLYGLVVVGALISVVALYYYLMVALQVYIKDPVDERRMAVDRSLGFAIFLCIAGTIAIGVYPRPVIEMGERASAALIAARDIQATAVQGVLHDRLATGKDR